MTARFADPVRALATHRQALNSERLGFDLLLLDLDGTLVDPSREVATSVTHAFHHLGLPAPDAATLRTFIGPPMPYSMRAHGIPDERIPEAMLAYRESYAQILHDSPPYPHVLEMLAELRAAADLTGARIVLATSKPERYAHEVVAHTGLDQFLHAAYGASLDETTRGTKAAVIAHALESERAASGITVAAQRCLMVGDREHDIEGAAAHDIACLGVLWGFGSRDELAAAGALDIVSEVSELPAHIRAASAR